MKEGTGSERISEGTGSLARMAEFFNSIVKEQGDHLVGGVKEKKICTMEEKIREADGNRIWVDSSNSLWRQEWDWHSVRSFLRLCVSCLILISTAWLTGCLTAL